MLVTSARHLGCAAGFSLAPQAARRGRLLRCVYVHGAEEFALWASIPPCHQPPALGCRGTRNRTWNSKAPLPTSAARRRASGSPQPGHCLVSCMTCHSKGPPKMWWRWDSAPCPLCHTGDPCTASRTHIWRLWGSECQRERTDQLAQRFCQ